MRRQPRNATSGGVGTTPTSYRFRASATGKGRRPPEIGTAPISKHAAPYLRASARPYILENPSSFEFGATEFKRGCVIICCVNKTPLMTRTFPFRIPSNRLLERSCGTSQESLLASQEPRVEPQFTRNDSCGTSRVTQ